ncbi:hypothetical protein BpHYR1_045271 [Brachionus plicatilis]|uniref:Uncharacterized protein n=1 Tax=Brachionus plicatilis TaxID=10195 RepID=A0A3M7QTI9_BRAPC|nr:hypothetical protein BpHYR1_045271 [Brachionus plicatilis]
MPPRYYNGRFIRPIKIKINNSYMTIASRFLESLYHYAYKTLSLLRNYSEFMINFARASQKCCINTMADNFHYLHYYLIFAADFFDSEFAYSLVAWTVELVDSVVLL